MRQKVFSVFLLIAGVFVEARILQDIMKHPMILNFDTLHAVVMPFDQGFSSSRASPLRLVEGFVPFAPPRPENPLNERLPENVREELFTISTEKLEKPTDKPPVWQVKTSPRLIIRLKDVMDSSASSRENSLSSPNLPLPPVKSFPSHYAFHTPMDASQNRKASSSFNMPVKRFEITQSPTEARSSFMPFPFSGNDALAPYGAPPFDQRRPADVQATVQPKPLSPMHTEPQYREEQRGYPINSISFRQGREFGRSPVPPQLNYFAPHMLGRQPAHPGHAYPMQSSMGYPRKPQLQPAVREAPRQYSFAEPQVIRFPLHSRPTVSDFTPRPDIPRFETFPLTLFNGNFNRFPVPTGPGYHNGLPYQNGGPGQFGGSDRPTSYTPDSRPYQNSGHNFRNFHQGNVPLNSAPPRRPVIQPTVTQNYDNGYQSSRPDGYRAPDAHRQTSVHRMPDSVGNRGSLSHGLDPNHREIVVTNTLQVMPRRYPFHHPEQARSYNQYQRDRNGDSGSFRQYGSNTNGYRNPSEAVAGHNRKHSEQESTSDTTESNYTPYNEHRHHKPDFDSSFSQHERLLDSDDVSQPTSPIADSQRSSYSSNGLDNNNRYSRGYDNDGYSSEAMEHKPDLNEIPDSPATVVENRLPIEFDSNDELFNEQNSLKV